MSYEPVDLVRVTAWGEVVGYLARAARRNAYAFSYEPDWVRTGVEIAPLHMPARNGAPYVFSQLSDETFHRLPPAIADSLPDRFGNAIIDAYMAREGIAQPQITALDRLAYLGKRTMGALCFEPELGPDRPVPSTLEMSSLVEEARQIVTGAVDDEGNRAQSLAEIFAVGTSAGGARAKAVVAIDQKTLEVRAGNLDVPEGFTQYVLKFDGVASTDKGLTQPQPYCRREYAYHLMAVAAGITMSECRLLEENGRAHFLTERFDRRGSERLHMQTLCALQHLDYNLVGTHDYAQHFLTVDALGLGADVREEVFRRMVFNVLAVNHDDHTKNTAFLMERDGTWSLAPAYDLTFAYDPDNMWLREHLTGVGGKFSDISTSDMLDVADRFEVPHARRIVATVRDVVASWSEFAAEAGMTASDTAVVAATLKTVDREA